MGFDLEKRVASELNRLEDEVAHSPELKPAKRVEHFKRIAEELKQRLLGGEAAEEAPGKRTQIDDLLGAAITRMTQTAARAQEQLTTLPWQAPSRYDEYRATGLREVITALGSERKRLQSATVASAEPTIAARAGVAQNKAHTNAAGQAMWRVAERRAATLYRHAMDAGEVASEDPIIDEALAKAGSGQALPTSVRKKMEAELGISLSRVRVHTDPVAAAAAKAVRAVAFTVGEDIFFSENSFAPDSREGQKLLAHELTHVAQAYQGRTSTGGSGISVSQPGEALEREADAVAERVERRATQARRPARRAATPSRGAKPRLVESAPTLAKPAPTRMLMRRAQTPPDQAHRPTTPREQVPNDKRGTKPTLQRVRDHVQEHAKRDLKKEDLGSARSPIKQAKKGMTSAVKNMKGEVKNAVKAADKDPAQKAKQLLKADDTKSKATKKQAKDAKKQLAQAPAQAKGDKAGAKKDGGDGADAKGPVKFKKISDWQKYMPEDLPDTDPREKKRILELVQKKVNKDRKQSGGMLNKLAGAQKSAAAEVRAMAPGLVGTVKSAQSAATGAVSAAEGAQCAAVQAAVAGAQAMVRATQAAMVGQINAAHAATTTAIRAAKMAAIVQLTTAKTTTLADITSAETAALAAVAAEFSTACGRLTQMGADKASEAMGVPATVSWPYDGDKLEAAEKAARETAQGYADAMPGEAAKAAADLRSHQAEPEAQVREMAASQREAVNQAFNNAKNAINQQAEQALSAADSAKSSAVAQVNSTASSTSAQLSAHGASQVSAIRSAGAAARQGIATAGAAAIQGIQQGADKAAKGLESGSKGLVNGAKQIEAPDPEQTKNQVQDAASQLRQGVQQVGSGLKQSAQQSAQSLNQQAQQAAQGMAQTANAAKATAQQMGQGAVQGMTQIASGAKDGLQQLRDGFKEGVKSTTDAVKEGFQSILTGLQTAYTNAQTQLATSLNTSVESARTGFNQAVPTDERAAIIENGDKAAAAVKPWWQRALAFVVQIIVAVVVVIAVAAIIGATGGAGLILVGALGGALSTVAGTMASNLILGNGLMDGITVRSVLAGAIGGAVTAGFGSAVGGLLGRGAAGSVTQRLGTTLATPGAGGFGGAAFRTGVNVTGDLVGDAATQLVATGTYSFSMETLVTSIATNSVTQTGRYDAFQTRMQQGIRNHVPSIDISTGRGNTPMGPRAQGEAPGNYFNVQGNRAGNQGNLATRPSGGGDGAPAPRGGDPTPNTGGGDGPAPRGGGDQSARGGNDGQAPRPGNDGQAPRPGNDGQAPRPGNDGPAPGNDGPARPGNDAPSGRGNDGPSRPGNDGPARPGNDGPAGRGNDGDGAGRDGTTTPGRDGNQDGNGQPRDGETLPPTSRGDADPANGNRGRDGDNDGNGNRGDRGGDDGDGRPRGDRNQDRGDGEGQGPRNRGDDDGDGGGNDRGNDGNDRGGNDRGDDGGNDRGGNDRGNDGQDRGPESESAGELADLGYPNPTRANADRAANAIEQGGRPDPSTVRDTNANQQGLRDLQQVDADPSLSPQSRENIRRDVANQMRGDEPTGNLPRDIAEARAREQARVQAEQARVQAEQAAQNPAGRDGAPAQDGNAPPGGDRDGAAPDGTGPRPDGANPDAAPGRYASDGGATPERIAEIQATPKPNRPDPSEYLSPDYIRAHQDAFADGGSRIVLRDSHDRYGTFREDGTTFVMTRADADALLARAGGDPARLEAELGLPAGQLSGGGGLLRIDFPPGDLRIPSGNEAGANSQWIPGGRTPNGKYEAVANRNTSGSETITPINPGGGPRPPAGPDGGGPRPPSGGPRPTDGSGGAGPRPADTTPTSGGPRPADTTPTTGGPRPADTTPTTGGPRPADTTPTTGGPRPADSTPALDGSGPSRPADVSRDGLTGGRSTMEDFDGGRVTDQTREDVRRATEQDNNRTLDEQADSILNGPPRTEEEVLAAIQNGEMPRYVARVGPARGHDTFGRPREFIFATEPADLRGLSPEAALRRVGWTDADIRALGPDTPIEVVIVDTSVAIQPNTGRDGTQNPGGHLGRGNFEWADVRARAIADSNFRATVEGNGVDPARLPELFDILQQTPVGAEPRTADPDLARQATLVREALSSEYGANALYSGTGITIQPDGSIGGREIRIDDNGTGMRLNTDPDSPDRNAVRVPLGTMGNPRTGRPASGAGSGSGT